jgi:hypothetical protein
MRTASDTGFAAPRRSPSEVCATMAANGSTQPSTWAMASQWNRTRGHGGFPLTHGDPRSTVLRQKTAHTNPSHDLCAHSLATRQSDRQVMQ